MLGHQVTMPLELADTRVPCLVERLDQVAGQEVLIKYTSAKVVSVRDAMQQPSKDPLPAVYRMLRPNAQVAYACVGAHLPALLYLSPSAAEQVPQPYHEAEIPAVQHYINQLWREFQAGVASVAPLNAHSCYGCDLPSLCRINTT